MWASAPVRLLDCEQGWSPASVFPMGLGVLGRLLIITHLSATHQMLWPWPSVIRSQGPCGIPCVQQRLRRKFGPAHKPSPAPAADWPGAPRRSLSGPLWSSRLLTSRFSLLDAHWSRSGRITSLVGGSAPCGGGAVGPPSPPRIGRWRELSLAVVSGKERKWRRSRARPKSRLFLRGFVQFPPTRCLRGRGTGPVAGGEDVSCPLGPEGGRGRRWEAFLWFRALGLTLGPNHLLGSSST